MRIEMDPEQTVVELLAECGSWQERADLIQRLADSRFPSPSRLHRDNAAAASGTGSLAVARYVEERCWNAARTLRALHCHVFDALPGQFNLDATTMYPLMRAVMEDSAALSWLQAPDDRAERLTRAFRVMASDNAFFTENHRLLGLAAAGSDEILQDLGAALAEHMVTERSAARAHLEHLAGQAGLNVAEAMRSVATSAPVKVVYGNESVEFVTWKLLSDLSHFSFLMLRHLAESRIPGSATPLLHATVLSFARTMNRVVDDAVAHLTLAAAPDS